MQEAMGSSPIISILLCAFGRVMLRKFACIDLMLGPSDSGGFGEELEIIIPEAEMGSGDSTRPPSFADLFDDEPSTPGGLSASDLKIRTFKKCEPLSEDPKPYFKDSDYYKVLLGNEGDSAKRVHQVLQEFIKAEDPQEKSVQRQRLVPAYWDFYASVASKIGGKMPIPKQLLLRFGILLPTAIDADQRQIISSIISKNDSGEPIFYADEWLKEVAYGRVSTSAIDETKGAQKGEGVKLNALMEKTRGRYDAQVSLITNILEDMNLAEKMLVEHAQNIANHYPSSEYGNLAGPYNDSQRSSFSEVADILRRLGVNNRKLQIAFGELSTVQEQLDGLRARGEDMPEDSAADAKAVVEEVNTVKQMAKMAVGRQGNHFPMLSKQYFRGTLRDICTRENAINALFDVEYLDGGIFLRTFKQQTNRIVPNIILLPCYGDFGVCWEPFERFNRATSRGRIALPMYPKELRVAVIAACGDLRWQVAKEKAQHYWMEEGLTGWYYQWFSEQKLKGDVKDKFIEDYVLWITKEAEGTQKLERPVREIFWRYMPFPQERKDSLKNRGFVYAELAKKDLNRSMSDGY